MLGLTALLSLAAFVAADETFQLTAKGNNINAKVGIDGSKLALNNNPTTFVLQTPSGYLTADGQNVVLTPQGIEVSSSNKSKDFGIEAGKLRSGATMTKFDFYSCPDGTIANFQCQDGVAITLYTGEVTETSTASSSSATSSNVAPSSSVVSSSTSNTHSSSSITEAPHSSASVVTDYHSTLVTVTSCLDHSCHKPSNATVSTYEGAGTQAKYAAGAIAVAGALLL